MFPSFFYAVPWRDAATVLTRLKQIGVPYRVDQKEDGIVVFLFPDVPVRLYGLIRKLFGSDGKSLT